MNSPSAAQPNRHISDVRPEFIVLGLLLEKSTHGYDLYRRFKTHLGRVWHISQSQMYALIKRLESLGLIAGSEGENGAGLSRRCLSITESGREHFSFWLNEPSVCSARIIRLEYVTRLFFAGRRDKSFISKLIKSQIAAAEKELQSHEKLYVNLDERDTYNRLGIDFRVNQMRSILNWLRESPKSISRFSD